MRSIHLFIWAVFILSLLFLRLQDLYIHSWDHHLDIIGLEFANAAQGAAMLHRWDNTMVDTASLLSFAWSNTLVDFLFVIGYVGVLMIVSNHLMQRQPIPALNELLRPCFILAVLAGSLDILENGILLFNMYHYRPTHTYISTRWISYYQYTVDQLCQVCLHFIDPSYLDGLTAGHSNS
jgi:hypothetical protein